MKRTIRIEVSDLLFNRLADESAAADLRLATYCRNLLTQGVQGEVSRNDWTPLTDTEKEAIREWHRAAMIGDWARAKPRDWRSLMHLTLTKHGHALPPLPKPRDHKALVTWMHAVHQILPGDRPAPPRY